MTRGIDLEDRSEVAVSSIVGSAVEVAVAAHNHTRHRGLSVGRAREPPGEPVQSRLVSLRVYSVDRSASVPITTSGVAAVQCGAV